METKNNNVYYNSIIRFVRKFFEDCCGNQLTRIAKEHKKSNKPYTNKELRTILPCDLNKEIFTTIKIRKNGVSILEKKTKGEIDFFII